MRKIWNFPSYLILRISYYKHSPEEIIENVIASFPTAIVMISQEYFESLLFPVLILYKLISHCIAVAIQESLINSLSFPGEKIAINRHVWLSSIFYYHSSTTKAVLEQYMFNLLPWWQIWRTHRPGNITNIPWLRDLLQSDATHFCTEGRFIFQYLQRPSEDIFLRQYEFLHVVPDTCERQYYSRISPSCQHRRIFKAKILSSAIQGKIGHDFKVGIEIGAN